MRSLATNACGTPHRDAPPRSDDPDTAERWAKRSGPEGIAGAAGRPLRAPRSAARDASPFQDKRLLPASNASMRSCTLRRVAR